jgi:hypothetical protein
MEKRIVTLVLADNLVKQILDEYMDFADFISIETEAEADLKKRGFDTWDNLEDDCDCNEDDCDCDTRI